MTVPLFLVQGHPYNSQNKHGDCNDEIQITLRNHQSFPPRLSNILIQMNKRNTIRNTRTSQISSCGVKRNLSNRKLSNPLHSQQGLRTSTQERGEGKYNKSIHVEYINSHITTGNGNHSP